MQRRRYREQLRQVAFSPDAPLVEPAVKVLMELTQEDESASEEVILRLPTVVENKHTSVSQSVVNLLKDEKTVTVAADWLDNLMAKVPGKSIYIARYPVTNAQYRRFVEAGGYDNNEWWSQEGWQWRQGKPRYDWQKLDQPDYWQDSKWNRPDQPVVGVTWYEAEAYCHWLAEHTGRPYRLPAEAEWQRAAQGDDDRQYPWGNAWREGVCNTAEANIGQTSPVGQFSPDGDSPLGCADMSGNVWEWCQDWYDDQKTARVLRGGSWYFDRDYARCAVRLRDDPYLSLNVCGLRVVSPI
jgi:formylglycine-generating enzyme required for sulfatase activity